MQSSIREAPKCRNQAFEHPGVMITKTTSTLFMILNWNQIWQNPKRTDLDWMREVVQKHLVLNTYMCRLSQTFLYNLFCSLPYWNSLSMKLHSISNEKSEDIGTNLMPNSLFQSHEPLSFTKPPRICCSCHKEKSHGFTVSNTCSHIQFLSCLTTAWFDCFYCHCDSTGMVMRKGMSLAWRACH